MPYNAVGTKDGYIVIDAHLPKFWSGLCRAIQLKAIENDPRFETLDLRGRNRDELLKILDGVFPQKTSLEWLSILKENGVPCAPINDLKAALEDDVTRALNMVVDIEHKGVDLTFRAAGNPIRMPNAGEASYGSPPLLGEHTTEVLRDIAGYGDEKIGLLIRDGIVAQRADTPS